MKNIDNIMSLSVETLSQRQFEALKSQSLSILERVTSLLRNDNYEAINDMLRWSPEGDGQGRDNYYIGFYDDMDISEICDKLRRLKNNIID